MKVTWWPTGIRNWYLTHITKSTGRHAEHWSGHPCLAEGQRSIPWWTKREPQAWVEEGKIMSSPSYHGKNAFVASYFLKCLSLENIFCPTSPTLPRLVCSGDWQHPPGANEAVRLGWQGDGCKVRGTSEDIHRQNKSAFTERAPCKTKATRSRYVLKVTDSHIWTQTPALSLL